MIVQNKKEKDGRRRRGNTHAPEVTLVVLHFGYYFLALCVPCAGDIEGCEHGGDHDEYLFTHTRATTTTKERKKEIQTFR